ncbi:hypothetical protein M413DRAFT_29470 [Hebeloma cylindrosporum]|uniref:Uncharacterized protein n=1 Tax=Hebeloma cylindrosporum TaxID=76867 RepID=A0A0C2XNQ6_HEBCY|nr:hypothetical protein M413DRAFT_29470 [Hebeloma cylindrosporum h7]
MLNMLNCEQPPAYDSLSPRQRPPHFVWNPPVIGGAGSTSNNLAPPAFLGTNPSPQYRNAPQGSAYHPAKFVSSLVNYNLHPASNSNSAYPPPGFSQSVQNTGSTPYPAASAFPVPGPSGQVGNAYPTGNPHYTSPRNQQNNFRSPAVDPAQRVSASSGYLASSSVYSDGTEDASIRTSFSSHGRGEVNEYLDGYYEH